MQPGEMPTDPSMWGMTIKDLYDFAIEVLGSPNQLFEQQSDGPSMYDVVTKHVKPMTKGTGQSLAVHLQCRAQQPAKRATVFISHSWGESFPYLVQLLCFGLIPDHVFRRAAAASKTVLAMEYGLDLNDLLPPDAVIWICALSIDQNASIQGTLGSDVLQSPFARVLEQSAEMLIVYNPRVMLYSRVWCCLEAHIGAKKSAAGTLRLRAFGIGPDQIYKDIVAYEKGAGEAVWGSITKDARALRQSFYDSEQVQNLVNARNVRREEKFEQVWNLLNEAMRPKLWGALLEFVEAFLKEFGHSIDVRDAQASVDSDRVMIQASIADSVVEVNATVNKLWAAVFASKLLHLCVNGDV